MDIFSKTGKFKIPDYLSVNVSLDDLPSKSIEIQVYDVQCNHCGAVYKAQAGLISTCPLCGKNGGTILGAHHSFKPVTSVQNLLTKLMLQDFLPIRAVFRFNELGLFEGLCSDLKLPASLTNIYSTTMFRAFPNDTGEPGSPSHTLASLTGGFVVDPLAGDCPLIVSWDSFVDMAWKHNDLLRAFSLDDGMTYPQHGMKNSFDKPDSGT